MKRYEIRDEFDGRVLLATSRHPLSFVRRKARELANQNNAAVVVVNTITNRLLDVVQPDGEPDPHDEPICDKYATAGIGFICAGGGK